MKTKVIGWTSVKAVQGSQSLVLACNERGIQTAIHTFLNILGVEEYTLRPMFGSVNCLAFNDKKNLAQTLELIKKYIQHEGVNKIVIMCHARCLADKKPLAGISLAESIHFQFEKGNKARNAILGALSNFTSKLSVEVYVIASHRGKHFLHREVRQKAKKAQAAAT